jgi:metal-responsive CopG/Arc/MetJ family transcriptional regulator
LKRGDTVISDNKVRKQISFDNELLKQAENQADKEDRTLSNLITVALKKYLKELEAASE